jgi:hypothetical protein
MPAVAGRCPPCGVHPYGASSRGRVVHPSGRARPVSSCPVSARPACSCLVSACLSVVSRSSSPASARRWRWDQVGAARHPCTTGTGRVQRGRSRLRAARSTARAGLDAGEAAQVVRQHRGASSRTWPGGARAAAAALGRGPGRSARRAGRPWWRLRQPRGAWPSAALLHLPRRRRLGWMRDYGGWSWWSLPARVDGPESPMGLPAGMACGPSAAQSSQQARPARCRQRCDLRFWPVGLPGLEPGTSSLSANGRQPLCGPPFPQVAPDRRGQSYAFNRHDGMRSHMVS